MTVEELGIFHEDLKNGFSSFKKCVILPNSANYYEVKHDSFGDVREMSVDVHVRFMKPVKCTELCRTRLGMKERTSRKLVESPMTYRLILKPKRNEIKVVPDYFCKTKVEFPKECLMFIADKFNLKIIS